MLYFINQCKCYTDIDEGSEVEVIRTNRKQPVNIENNGRMSICKDRPIQNKKC